MTVSYLGRSPPPTITNPPIMAVGGRFDDNAVPDHYPGSNLSISELCHALELKLAQTNDTGYAYSTTRHLLSITDSLLQTSLSPTTGSCLTADEANHLTIVPGRICVG